MIPLVDLKVQYASIKEEIDKTISNVVESSSFILGENVKSFEKNFADFCETKYAVGVSSGTSALKIALLALGIKSGDEVITVPNTFIATTEMISAIGAKPVFVDVDKETYNINVNKIEKAITEKTKAIIPVHLYGQMADMKIITEIANKYNLKVIEDAAQAHGAEHNNKKSGNFGEIATFSFFPAKNLGAYGDAGAIVTNNKEIADKSMLLRDHGRISKYEHLIEGYNHRIDALQAAILDVKLKYLEKWINERRKNAKSYNELLKNVILPVEKSYNKHAYHLYVIRTKKRNELMEHLKKNNISTGIHYPIPLHLQQAYKHLEHKEDSFPVTENCAKEILSLPMFPELKKEEIEYICKKINLFL